MSGMRKKRKARGRAASEAADALAAQAGDGLEIVEAGEGEDAPEGDSAQAEGEGDADQAERAPEPQHADADASADHGAELAAEAEGPSDAEIEAELASLADAAGEADPEAEADLAEAPAGHPDPATLGPAQLKALIEALLFASDKPLTVQRLRQLTRVADLPRVQAIVDEIRADFADRGVVLQEVSGGYLFRTHAAYSTWVQQLIQGRPVRLSRAQLETLAIVAYRQPITRPEIDQIRGVDSGATLKLLLDRTLIRILGKKEEPGRPLLYGSTKEFLDFFSLKDLRELPTLREYSELSEESRQMVERVTGEPVVAGESAAAAAAAAAAGVDPEIEPATPPEIEPEPELAPDPDPDLAPEPPPEEPAPEEPEDPMPMPMPEMEPDPDPIAAEAADAQDEIDAAVAAADSLTDELDPLGDRLS